MISSSLKYLIWKASKNRLIVKKVSIIRIFFFLSISVGCKKFIEVDAPVNTTNSKIVYSSDATASSVLTSIYANLSQGGITSGLTSLTLLGGLSSDELTLYNLSDQTYLPFYRNTLLNTTSSNFWAPLYSTIFIANSAIEGLSASRSLTPAVKKQLLGEARFIRAFCYFYLVNLFGDVPLAVTTDYKVNSTLARAPKEEVWMFIVSDLKAAQSLLSDVYLKADVLGVTEERVRPTRWAATAMLARAFLYIGDYGQAEKEASGVINNTDSYSLVDLDKAFLKNNNEAIWQLQPVNTGENTRDALLFVLPPSGPNTTVYPVYLNSSMANSFENDDLRATKWINNVKVDNQVYYYPNKYKVARLNAPVTEYLTVLRLSEQYLIRAEARGQLGRLVEAAADLNLIRQRAGLSGMTYPTKTALIAAVLQERKAELFAEWGHRWLDMKRTGVVDAVMTQFAPQKGSIWRSTAQLYPIPLSELQKDPNLSQNDGY